MGYLRFITNVNANLRKVDRDFTLTNYYYEYRSASAHI